MSGRPALDAVVVGAGLAAARQLQEAGRRVRVLEASDGVGGRVRSDRVEGFVLDGGLQVLLTAYPGARRMLDYAPLGLRAFEPGALIRHGGRWIEPLKPGDGASGSLDSAVRRQLREWFGEEVDTWRLLRVDRIEHAHPLQQPETVAPPPPARPAEGLLVCGGHRTDASVQGALRSGHLAAQGILTAR